MPNTDDFYEMAAVWSLEPAGDRHTGSPVRVGNLVLWLASQRGVADPVVVTGVSGDTWSLHIRAVGHTWISGHTATQPERGLVMSVSAIACVEGGVVNPQGAGRIVSVSLVQALTPSLAANPRVRVCAGAAVVSGRVVSLTADYLELISLATLDGRQRRVFLRVQSIDVVCFLEPGDSF